MSAHLRHKPNSPKPTQLIIFLTKLSQAEPMFLIPKTEEEVEERKRKKKEAKEKRREDAGGSKELPNEKSLARSEAPFPLQGAHFSIAGLFVVGFGVALKAAKRLVSS